MKNIKKWTNCLVCALQGLLLSCNIDLKHKYENRINFFICFFFFLLFSLWFASWSRKCDEKRIQQANLGSRHLWRTGSELWRNKEAKKWMWKQMFKYIKFIKISETVRKYIQATWRKWNLCISRRSVNSKKGRGIKSWKNIKLLYECLNA